MHFAILTQPLHHNYGGLLQNYALQQVLKRGGHQVETIWYETPKASRPRVFLSHCKWGTLHLLFPRRIPPIQYGPSYMELAAIRKNTDAFVNKYISRSEKPISVNDLRTYAADKNFDGYIAGSDQCWRPEYNWGPVLPAMFLDFAKDIKNVKRIAYAASFGTDQWEFTPEMTRTCAPLARMFDLITVREDSGVNLCRKYLGTDATHVLDPTMLLSKEDYIALAEAENEPKSAGSLFTYILDPNPGIDALINRMAGVNGLQPFTAMPKYPDSTRTKNNIRNHIDDCVYPRVTSWLRAFMDAEMTIVDSFHGMVFSIIFNKPFWVISNKDRGYSRFTSLLNLFGLQDRLIDESEVKQLAIKSDGFDSLQKTIDWQTVNAILQEERERCIALLKEGIRAEFTNKSNGKR